MARKPTKKAPAPTDLEPDEELQEFDGGVTVPIRKRNVGGRPPKYRPEYAIIAGQLLRRGATINELSEAFGVSNGCIHAWKHRHQAFHDQFLEVSDSLISRAERSLAERAVGYTFDSVKVFNYKGVPVIVPIKEHVPPDVAALKYYLAAKRPDKWIVREEVTVTGDEAFKEIFMRMGEAKKAKGEDK